MQVDHITASPVGKAGRASSGNGVLMTRSVRAIYGAVCKLSPKAEKLDPQIVTGAFVDAGHVDRIYNNTSQFIEGRRGTGKTHLLLYLTERANGEVQENGSIAVYLDARDLHRESGQDDGDPKAIARRVYREMLSEISVQLRDIDRKILWHNTVPTARSSWDQHVARESSKALQSLDAAIAGAFTDHERTETRTTRESSSTEAGYRVGVTGGKVDGPLDVSGDISGRRQQAVETEERSVARSRIDHSEVRKAIEHFLFVNELETIFINIDEWSSLPRESQPYLAEYLKRTFSPSRQAVLKIAVLPYQTQLSTTKEGVIIGLEREGDIYLGADLDSELVFGIHPDRSWAMLASLLHNHIRLFLSEEEEKEIEFLESAERMIEALFSDAAFKRMLVFSQGNPRDFLFLFRSAYMNLYGRQSTRQIGAPLVETAAKDLGTEKLENIQGNPEAISLFNSIMAQVLQKEKKAAFLVNTRHSSNEIFGYLLHQRVLHIWDKSYSSPNVKGERFHFP